MNTQQNTSQRTVDLTRRLVRAARGHADRHPDIDRADAMCQFIHNALDTENPVDGYPQMVDGLCTFVRSSIAREQGVAFAA